jgi:hypothetical protein
MDKPLSALIAALAGALSLGCGGGPETSGPPPPPPPPPPTPASVEKVSGDGQNGALGGVVPDSLVVRVRDRSGNPMAGVSVTWAVVAGGGTTSAAASTIASGLAAIAWTLGPAGENAVEARVGSLSPARFTATGVAPGAGLIAFEAMPGPFNQPRETDIYVMSPDGRNLRRIVEHAADDGEPAWSPDGSKLAFKTTRDGDKVVSRRDPNRLPPGPELAARDLGHER